MTMTMEYKEYAALPTGEYPARIVEVGPAPAGKFGPGLKWIMDLGDVEDTEGNVEARRLSVFTPAEITPNNKLGKLVVAAGLELGVALDESDFINRRVVLLVTREISDDGKSYFNRVQGFDRVKAKGGKAAKPPADDDEEM